jgi:hypothetical protein
MFLSIINDSFRRTPENVKNQSEEILSFMIRRFQLWTGWKKSMEEEIREERDAVRRQKHFYRIERFSERMNQLLEAINRVSVFGLMKFVCHSFVLALYESTSRIITSAKNERLMIFGNFMSHVFFILFKNKIVLKVA